MIQISPNGCIGIAIRTSCHTLTHAAPKGEDQGCACCKRRVRQDDFPPKPSGLVPWRRRLTLANPMRRVLNQLIRIGEGSVAGLIQEFVLRRFTSHAPRQPQVQP
jgi:hypothetical protein